MAVRFFDCITEFIFAEDQPERSDVIFVPGGNYPEAALQAAALYREGFAPYVLPSGRYSIVRGCFIPPQGKAGSYVQPGQEESGMGEAQEEVDQERRERWKTEWEYLHDLLLANGVPEHAVLREDQATYTYENAVFSRRVMDACGLKTERAILCCQAFHARRCLLYYQEQFPKTKFFVCPVVTKGIAKDTWYRSEEGIDTVLGELERCGAQFHEIMRRHRKDPGDRQCADNG